MSQANTTINSHIKSYLNYYCELPNSPKFAILLKGKWGSGKTWFINQYRGKLKAAGKKSLYVSLYGVSNYSEIEDSLFQQLHPFRSSKGMVIAGKVFKGFLKGTLKIDLNDDGKEDGTWNVSIPEINIPEKFNDSNFNLLIFDDLERCNMNIEEILGYINSFVESQDLKVVIIANEDEIDTKQKEYGRIKEKLIGKTFEIHPDFKGALNYFLIQITNQKTKNFVLSNIKLIQILFVNSQCKNLRILNQIVLDFERIFNILPQKALNKSDLVKEILILLTIFSIEISTANLKPQYISKIMEKLAKELVHKQNTDIQQDTNENQNKDNILFKQIFDKYNNIYPINFFNSTEFFPGLSWWEIFFDKGIVDEDTLEKVMLTSKYFQDENTANWLKLWRYSQHTDEIFKKILSTVELEYKDRSFEDIGIIKHITGLFLLFSEAGVYNKSKPDIINEAKKYIDELKQSGQLDTKYSDDSFGGYKGLAFQSKDSQEFKDFENYISQCQKDVMLQNMPNEARKLLNVMQDNIYSFCSIICLTDSGHLDNEQERYYNFPILQYLSPEEFFKTVLMLSYKDISYIFFSIKERYKVQGITEKLVDDLDFLKKVQGLLFTEISKRKGEISAYLLSYVNEFYLKETINHLEQVKIWLEQNNT
ncbi:MAG TPA: P-loop NTPase fold protein [Nostocaceae cyanobacterium]|nr:P-loop NTPase fold protein [Nostocaceae cyanobacterium]